jgi:5-methylcytosine-specific restriction protein B
MAQVDDIRRYVIDHKITPARQEGQSMVTVFAREIHAEMHLKARVVAVCGALDDPDFLKIASVRLLERSGQRRSPKSKWVFKLD